VKDDHPGKNVRVFFEDEARFGQKGTTTKVWAETGSRPTVIKQTRYEWAYMYGAVDPLTGDSSAFLARHVNTATMNEFLKVLSSEVGPDDHVVLILDRAGWHVSKALEIPPNIRGVIVLSIDDDSAFLEFGIRPGDVIESINQQPVNSPEEAIARLKRVLASEQQNVLMLINRHGTNRYLAMSLENKPNRRDEG